MSDSKLTVTGRPDRLSRWALAACLACWCGDGAHADTVELSGGVQVDGKIVRKAEGGAKPHLIIELDPDLRVAIPQTRVRKTITDKDLAWYKSQANTVGADAEAHYLLARECKKNGLKEQSAFHFRRAVDIDPNHSKARYALGYAPDGNKWVLYDDLQRQRGMISVGGTWKIPEVYAREKMLDQANDASKIWIKNFAKLRSLYLRGGKKAVEAMSGLEAIDDPMAASAIAEALEKSNGNDPDPRNLRRLYIKKLGAFRNSTSVQSLVKTGLWEKDAGIREEALRQLQDYGAPSAVATYLQMLKGDAHKPAEVSAALRALNFFPDPELWQDYVDAVVTRHKTIKQPGPGMQVGRSSLGGSGMSTGGKAEVIISKVQNPGAVQLLRQIAPDADYRYDQDAWRRYFADQLMQSPGDLRRDL